MNAIKTLVAVMALTVGGLVATGTAHAQTGTAKTSKATAAKNAKKAAALANEGKKLQDAGELDDALEKYEAALELDATNMTALTGAAWIHNDQKDYEKAKLVAAIAVLVDNKSTEAWRELGYAEWKLGNVEDGKKYLMQCSRTDLVAYEYLIALCEEQGDDDEAATFRKLKAKAEAELARK